MKEINHNLLQDVATANLEILRLFKNLSLMITRNDGVVIWEKANFSVNKDSSIGALTAGLWSASNAIGKAFDISEIGNGGLSYGGACSGIILLPINLNGDVYAFVLAYKNTLNPSKLKHQFRLMSKHIEYSYNDKVNHELLVCSGKEKTKVLFKNITDEEIDNLFTL